MVIELLPKERIVIGLRYHVFANVGVTAAQQIIADNAIAGEIDIYERFLQLLSSSEQELVNTLIRHVPQQFLDCCSNVLATPRFNRDLN